MQKRILLCVIAIVSMPAWAQTKPTPSLEELMKEYPHLRETKRQMDIQEPLAEYECKKKLDRDDPTVEWKKVNTVWQDDKWVVTRYGTRNLGMVTGICHVKMTGKKVQSLKSWLK